MKKDLKYAFERTIPILIGFFPLGLAYGILMLDAGYNFIWSGLTSLFVFAGSLQFLMVNFFAGGVSLFTIIVMALLLNSRHIFYGLSFIDKFKEFGLWKYFVIYGLTDESYSMLCSYRPKEGADETRVHIFSSLLIWFYWTFFSALGGLVGNFIPFDTTGIDFTLTALFTVILVDQLRDAPKKLPALIAVLSSLLCIAFFGASNFILPSLILTIAALIVLRPRLERENKSQSAEKEVL